MVFSKAFCLSLLALLPISIAAPTPEVITSSTEPIDWIPVDFNGKTLYVNSAALVDSSANPAKAVARALHRRSNNDKCGQSSFNANDPPYASTGDCEVIRDWAYTQNTNWGVWDNTPDTHGLWYYNSCVFEAGTRNVIATFIGSSDVGDVTRDALNIWQFLGQVAAKGNMGCENNLFGVLGTSSVNWQIKHS